MDVYLALQYYAKIIYILKKQLSLKQGSKSPKALKKFRALRKNH